MSHAEARIRAQFATADADWPQIAALGRDVLALLDEVGRYREALKVAAADLADASIQLDDAGCQAAASGTHQAHLEAMAAVGGDPE